MNSNYVSQNIRFRVFVRQTETKCFKCASPQLEILGYLKDSTMSDTVRTNMHPISECVSVRRQPISSWLT